MDAQTEIARNGAAAAPTARSPHMATSTNDMLWQAGAFLARARRGFDPSEIVKAWQSRGFSVRADLADGEQLRVKLEYIGCGISITAQRVGWAAPRKIDRQRLELAASAPLRKPVAQSDVDGLGLFDAVRSPSFL